METQNQYPQRDYSEMISLSHQVIGLPVRKAQILLKDLDLCMITYTWNDVSQITLEVVFKTSTLTCLFNQNDICEAVYLFLTDNKDLMKYISHCVKTYTYDFLLDGWTTDKCHISICRSENQGCFLFGKRGGSLLSEAGGICSVWKQQAAGADCPDGKDSYGGQNRGFLGRGEEGDCSLSPWKPSARKESAAVV